MIADFINNLNPDAKAAPKAKKAETYASIRLKGFIKAAAIGGVFVGGMYGLASKTYGNFSPWVLFASASVGASSCVVSKALLNQSGASEAERLLIQQTEAGITVANQLIETLSVTDQKFHTYQGALAQVNRTNAGVLASNRAAIQTVSDFGQGLMNLQRQGSTPQPQAQASEVHPSSRAEEREFTTVEARSIDLDLPDEAPQEQPSYDLNEDAWK